MDKTTDKKRGRGRPKGSKQSEEARAKMRLAHNRPEAIARRAALRRSPEFIAKLRLAAAKPCTFEGVTYASRGEAAQKLNISNPTLVAWLKLGRRRGTSGKRKPVTLPNGVTYESLVDVAEAIGVHPALVSTYLRVQRLIDELSQ